MKVLTTEQQTDLLDLLSQVGSSNIETQNRINYWSIELKPKRTRKIKDPNIQTDLTYNGTDGGTVI